jgi:hypothetical protein
MCIAHSIMFSRYKILKNIRFMHNLVIFPCNMVEDALKLGNLAKIKHLTSNVYIITINTY